MKNIDKKDPKGWVKIAYIFLPLLIAISLYQYLDIINSFKEEQKKTENYIMGSLYLIDKSYKASGAIMDKQLKKNMEIFLDEYNNNPNPKTLDLYLLKKRFGESSDLSVFNRDGVKIYTTFQKDLGFDSKKYPFVYENIKNSIQSGAFVSDKITQEVTTGLYRKYAYQATSDRKYVLQIALTSETLNNYLKDIKLSSLLKKVAETNPNIENIRILNKDGWEISFTSNQKPSNEIESIINEMDSAKNIIEIKSKGKITKYISTDFRDSSLDTKILVITYKTQIIFNEILKNLFRTLIGFILSIIFMMRFSYVFFNINNKSNEMKLLILLLILIILDVTSINFNIFNSKYNYWFFIIGFSILLYKIFKITKIQYTNIENFITYDRISKLPTRYLLNKDIDKLNKNYNFVLVALLIENINEIFNIIGHKNSDIILLEISEFFKKFQESTNLKLYNSYSLNYEIILKDYNEEEIRLWLQVFFDYIKDTPVIIGEIKVYLKIFVGVCFSNNIDDKKNIIKNAYESVDYSIKNGVNFHIYNNELSKKITTTYLVSQIAESINNNEFFLEYQPKLNLATNKIYGVEALVRWNHRELGRIPPNDFIPILEKTDSIKLLTNWVLKTVIEDMVEWKSKGIDLVISVNVCPRDLEDDNFSLNLFNLLEKNNVEFEKIELEITETDLIKGIDKVSKVLKILKVRGIKVSIDDFGTGYSSLSYLNSLPVNEIKIDKSFVDFLVKDKGKQDLLKYIIELAHILNKFVIAEGVEDEETINLLKLLNCENVQGYFISKPISKENLTTFLKNNN